MSDTQNILSDRRVSPDSGAMLILLNRQHDMIQQALHELIELGAALKAHMDAEPKTLTAAVESGIAKAAQAAFVNGDPVGHKEEHQAVIDAKKEHAKLWKKLIFNVATGLATVVAPWLLYVIWQALLLGPPK